MMLLKVLLAGATLVLHCADPLAGFWDAVEAEHFSCHEIRYCGPER